MKNYKAYFALLLQVVLTIISTIIFRKATLSNDSLYIIGMWGCVSLVLLFFALIPVVILIANTKGKSGENNIKAALLVAGIDFILGLAVTLYWIPIHWDNVLNPRVLGAAAIPITFYIYELLLLVISVLGMRKMLVIEMAMLCKSTKKALLKTLTKNDDHTPINP